MSAAFRVETRHVCRTCGGRVAVNDDRKAVSHYRTPIGRDGVSLGKLKICAGSGEQAEVRRG